MNRRGYEGGISSGTLVSKKFSEVCGVFQALLSSFINFFIIVSPLSGCVHITAVIQSAAANL